MRGISRGEINEATPERVFLDTFYRSSHYHFDNPSVLDKITGENLLSIYNLSILAKRAHNILAHVWDYGKLLIIQILIPRYIKKYLICPV